MPEPNSLFSPVRSSLLSPTSHNKSIGEHFLGNYYRVLFLYPTTGSYYFGPFRYSAREGFLPFNTKFTCRCLMLHMILIQHNGTAVWWSHNANTAEWLQYRVGSQITPECCHPAPHTHHHWRVPSAGKEIPSHAAGHNGHEAITQMGKKPVWTSISAQKEA